MIGQYHYFEECPLTDEDLAIMRGLASRIGGAYFTIHQSESGIAHRRDELAMLSYTRGKRPQGWRRDYYGRLFPIAKTHGVDYCRVDSYN
jgi:hypothetical protein